MTRSAQRRRADADVAPTGDDLVSHPTDPDGARLRECALPATADAVRAAREFTRNTLRQWDRDDLTDDAVLVASELVTNAVLHAVPDAVEDIDVEAITADDGDQPILLRLVSQTSCVLCIVRDLSSTPPRLAGGDVLAEDHRGLRIVAEVSTAWGWTPCEGRGKTVWAVLDAQPQPLGALVVGEESNGRRAHHGAGFQDGQARNYIARMTAGALDAR